MLKRKKLLAALLAGTMMLSLVGCGKKADTSGDTTDPNTAPCGNPADPLGRSFSDLQHRGNRRGAVSEGP